MAFYAATHYYGIDIANDFATLYRFTTKAARDKFVDEQQYREAASGNIKTETQTYNEARCHFPKAFRMVGGFHDVSDKRDWINHDGGTWAYWTDSNIFYK